jgi:hypothetical protein
LLPDVLDALANRSPVPLRVTITAAGSRSPVLVGRTWRAGEGAGPVEVAGPDWAVLAWATGRRAAVRDELPDAPDLADWR